MTKHLSLDLELLTGLYFPKKFKSSSKRYRCLIGVGANIKNPLATFKKFMHYLCRSPQIDLLKTSPILKNPPFGYLAQPDFYNFCVLVRTNLYPLELLKVLQNIEKIFGRKRSFKNAPRSLDLDLIFFENKRSYNHKLVLPHPCWDERQSVLIPLILMD